MEYKKLNEILKNIDEEKCDNYTITIISNIILEQYFNQYLRYVYLKNNINLKINVIQFEEYANLKYIDFIKKPDLNLKNSNKKFCTIAKMWTEVSKLICKAGENSSELHLKDASNILLEIAF